MKKRFGLAVVMAGALLGIHCSKGDITGTGLVKVDDNVYAFIAGGPSAAEGLGANSGFVVGSDAVMVIDSRQTPELAGTLYDAIRTVTDLPVRYVVNTHYHPDHTWGNSAFKDRGAVIIARPETRDAIEKYTPVYMEYYRNQKPETWRRFMNVRMSLPDSLMGERLKMDLGGIEVELYHLGAGHTAGDLFVFVPSARAVFAGGLVSNGYHANMGDQGADFANWKAILMKLQGMGIERIVPGQGTVCGKDVLARQIEYIDEVIEAGKTAIAGRKTLSEAAKATKIASAVGYLQENMLPFNLQAVYKKYLLDVVAPDFRIDLPDGFEAREGGGDSGRGHMMWVLQDEEGYSELEVSWQPTNRAEIILQDIHESIGDHQGANPEINMGIVGSKKIGEGGLDALAVHGKWAYNEKSKVMGAGLWTWAMIVDGGKLYSIRMSTTTGKVSGRETGKMEALENAAATFRRVR
ncbi:MAG: MBL fold metallo-hydrolase [Candidatus Krumholzibacteria bacterium]|jgi:glyoxylase-like metal-dependent hydrolase (beta-lactamase superfamily II)|nr:MBL fold metallo-hydrolase [Candidatus Krumholzibacteria bacterium]